MRQRNRFFEERNGAGAVREESPDGDQRAPAVPEIAGSPAVPSAAKRRKSRSKTANSSQPEASYIKAQTRPCFRAALRTFAMTVSLFSRPPGVRISCRKRWKNTPEMPYSRIQRK